MGMKIWTIIGIAKAAAGNQYPLGEEHAFVVMAAAEDGEDAFRRATDHMTQSGWSDVSCGNAAPVTVEALEAQEPIFLQAYGDALSGQSSGFIFSVPITEPAD